MCLNILRFALIAVCVTTCATASAEEDMAVNIKGWGTIFDPDGDCPWALGKGRITFVVPAKSHDFAAELGRWNAPRILADQSGDFSMEVKVTGTFEPGEATTIFGRRSYVGAGLLMAQDRNNYVSLHRGAVHLGDRGVRHYANFELRKGGRMALSTDRINLDAGKDIYLRLERRGREVHAAVSYDGREWQTYDPFETEFPASLSSGVVTVSSSSREFSPTYEKFSVLRKSSDGVEGNANRTIELEALPPR